MCCDRQRLPVEQSVSLHVTARTPVRLAAHGAITAPWPGCTTALRRQVRQAAGRDSEPTAAVIDSQSVRAADTVPK